MVLYLNKKHTLKLKLPIYRDDLIKWLVYAAVALGLAAVILACIAVPAFAKIKHVTLEAGEAFDATKISNDESAYFEGYDPSFLNRSGVYYFKMIANGKEREVRLEVVDTKAPEVTVKNVNCAVGGPLPSPEDFAESISDATGYVGEYVTPFGEIDKMGRYKAEIRFVDSVGNKTSVFEVEMNLISDNEGPELELSEKKVTVNIGERVDYLQYVAVSDNCIGEIKIEIDDSEVNYDEEGSYIAKITAIDLIGNRTQNQIKVLVNEAEDGE